MPEAPILPAWFLDLARCPATGSRLMLAEPELIVRLNKAIAASQIVTANDEQIRRTIDGGLIDAEAQWLYSIRAGIPSLVVGEAISLRAHKLLQEVP